MVKIKHKKVSNIKIFLIILTLLFILSFFIYKKISKNSSISIIKSLTNNPTQNIKFQGVLTNQYNNHRVEDYIDKNGANYSIDTEESEIIYYSAPRTNKYLSTKKPIISIDTAHNIATSFLKKNYKQFGSFQKGSSFKQTDGKGTDQDFYSFAWNKRINNNLFYQVVVAIDKYGNVVIMQREYISELINPQ